MHACWHGEHPSLSPQCRNFITNHRTSLHHTLSFQGVVLPCSGLSKGALFPWPRQLRSIGQNCSRAWQGSQHSFKPCSSCKLFICDQELMACSPIWTSTIRNWTHTLTIFWAGAVSMDQFQQIVTKTILDFRSYCNGRMNGRMDGLIDI